MTEVEGGRGERGEGERDGRRGAEMEGRVGGLSNYTACVRGDG